MTESYDTNYRIQVILMKIYLYKDIFNKSRSVINIMNRIIPYLIFDTKQSFIKYFLRLCAKCKKYCVHGYFKNSHIFH